MAADAQQNEWDQLGEGGLRNIGVPAKLPLPLPATLQGIGLTIVEDLILLRLTSRHAAPVKIALALADRSLQILSVEAKGEELPTRIRRLQR